MKSFFCIHPIHQSPYLIPPSLPKRSALVLNGTIQHGDFLFNFMTESWEEMTEEKLEEYFPDFRSRSVSGRIVLRPF